VVELLKNEDGFQETVLLSPKVTEEVAETIKLINVMFKSRMTELEFGAILAFPLTLYE
jgi:hypothetical protein